MESEHWKEQMEHIYTKDYYDCIKVLMPRFREIVGHDLRVLEIGLQVGVSTRAMLEEKFVKELISIDVDTCEKGLKEVELMEVGDRFEFKHTDSHTYMPKMDSTSFDMVYVDGDHREEGAAQDIQEGWRIVKKGGILMVHDVLHQKNFTGNKEYMGVARALWGVMWSHKVEAHYYPTWNGMAYIIKDK